MDQRCGRRVMSPVDEAEAIYCGRYGSPVPSEQSCRPHLHFPPPPHHPPPRHNNNFSEQDRIDSLEYDLKECLRDDGAHSYNHHQSPCHEDDCQSYNHRNYHDDIHCDSRIFERNHFATSSRHGHMGHPKSYSDDVQKSKTFGHHRHHHSHTSSEPVQDPRHCQQYFNDDHILTTAEVHNYPPKDGGSPKECNHKSYSSKKYQNKSQKYQDDSDAIHSLDERCAKNLDEILPARFAAMTASQRENNIQWNRDNIAATMERFEPGDYSYAYYEPGVSNARRLSSSAPGSSKSNNCCPKTPTNIPKSLIPKDRALRHTYLTRYGTEENIYEEITDGSRNACPKHRTAHQQSLISLNQSIVEEEVRRVENRHKRILGELNLSVEAMLMPESESPDSEKAEGGDNLEELLRVGPTDELLSPASCHPPDLDSGFSGSSSGASYVGSLRYKPRGSLSLPRASPPAVIYGSGRGVKILDNKDHKESKMNDCNNQCSRKNDNSILPSKSQNCVNEKGGFWSKKAWKKIPGFSSSNSINKAGLSGLLVRYTFRRKNSQESKAGAVGAEVAANTCRACLNQRC